jgi:hypothetical protein
MKTPCEEWSWILFWYRSAVRIYSDAGDALSVARSPAFNEAWEVSEEARKACGRFRAALLEHEHRHSCQAPLGPGQEIPNTAPLSLLGALRINIPASDSTIPQHQSASPRSSRTLRVGKARK